MGKVTAWELISLDGVMEKPEEWAYVFHNDEIAEASASEMTDSGALLLGRITYEELSSHWPNQLESDPMANYINNISKFVVSTILEEPLEWNNSTLIDENITKEITELKQESDLDLTIIGSGALVRSLLHDGVLDELMVLVHPLLLGSGKHLFGDRSDHLDLDLVDSRTFSTGVVSLTYRPAGTDEKE
ncbi:dihydrofolate reductase family protein [Natronococcus wangiae]|uniref:dihydrofolate reductase family protein n=1 Tax=Natronococcus wangiae TaxID=3068275 RepID=UPI00273D33CB|nr:dihydrofolate reductase family protein [Natronococcus sp. AD5]